MTFKDQVLYRMKAILTGLGVTLVSFLTWLVTYPDTAAAIQQVIPAPYAQLVPIVLAAIGAVLLVNRVPNKDLEPTGADNDDELTGNTTAITLPTTEDGVETGAGR